MLYRSMVLPVVAIALVACGSEDPSTLERAEDRLAQVERGEMALTVAASAGAQGASTEPIGYSVAGTFDTTPDRELPVLDLVYTRQLGPEDEVVEVISDGSRLVVVTDGVPTDVPPERAAALQLGEGDGPIDALSLNEWIVEPRESDGPTTDGVATRRITGGADAAAVLSDLSLMLAQVAGGSASEELDDDAVERIRSIVADSSVEILVGDDDYPRSIRVRLDFGGNLPAEFEEVFGTLANVSLEVELTLTRPGQPVTPPAMP